MIDPLSVRTGIERAHLETALALQMHGSFRRTAEALNMKVSTVSRRIRDLEFQLGAAIFERQRRRIVPTGAGRIFLRETARLLVNFHGLVLAVRKVADGQAGQISIGYHGSAACGNLFRLLFERNPVCPDVQHLPIELPYERIFDGLECGALDLAIVRGQPEPFRGRSVALWRERILVALPETHRLAHKSAIIWADLADEVFLLTSHDPIKHTTRLITERLYGHSVVPQITIHPVSHAAILHMVGLDQGISLGFGSIASGHHPRVVFRELSGPQGLEYVTSFACWRDYEVNSALRRLLRYLFQKYPPAADPMSAS